MRSRLVHELSPILSVTPVDVRTRLKDFLTSGFSYNEDLIVNPSEIYDGFEKLNAELVIMLGDEAYTEAFSPRFDWWGPRTCPRKKQARCCGR